MYESKYWSWSIINKQDFIILNIWYFRRPALTKAALLRFNAGEKTAADSEKKRINNEFGSANNNHSSRNNFDYLRARSTTPSSQLMTRSAYDYSSMSRNDTRKAKTPQLPRRSSSRAGTKINMWTFKLQLKLTWRWSNLIST